MLNLLPHQKRKLIRSELNSRRTIVVLIFAVATLIILVIFLLPTFLLARVKYEQVSEENITVNKQIDAGKSKETDFTERQKNIITLLQKDLKTATSSSDLIKNIISNRVPNIILSSFSIDLKSDEETVIVRGIAKTRDDLVHFKQMLEKDKLWNSVDLPISDLGPAKDNSFSFTLITKNK